MRYAVEASTEKQAERLARAELQKHSQARSLRVNSAKVVPFRMRPGQVWTLR